MLSKWYNHNNINTQWLIQLYYLYIFQNQNFAGERLAIYYVSEFMNGYLLNFSFQSNRCCVTLIDEEYGNTYYDHNIAVIISYNSYAVQGPNIVQITPMWDSNNSKELAWDVYVDEEVYF